MQPPKPLPTTLIHALDSSCKAFMHLHHHHVWHTSPQQTLPPHYSRQLADLLAQSHALVDSIIVGQFAKNQEQSSQNYQQPHFEHVYYLVWQCLHSVESVQECLSTLYAAQQTPRHSHATSDCLLGSLREGEWSSIGDNGSISYSLNCDDELATCHHVAEESSEAVDDFFRSASTQQGFSLLQAHSVVYNLVHNPHVGKTQLATTVVGLAAQGWAGSLDLGGALDVFLCGLRYGSELQAHVGSQEQSGKWTKGSDVAHGKERGTSEDAGSSEKVGNICQKLDLAFIHLLRWLEVQTAVGALVQTDRAQAASPVSWVVLCSKSHKTSLLEALLVWLASLGNGHSPTVLSLHNPTHVAHLTTLTLQVLDALAPQIPLKQKGQPAAQDTLPALGRMLRDPMQLRSLVKVLMDLTNIAECAPYDGSQAASATDSDQASSQRKLTRGYMSDHGYSGAQGGRVARENEQSKSGGRWRRGQGRAYQGKNSGNFDTSGSNSLLGASWQQQQQQQLRQNQSQQGYNKTSGMRSGYHSEGSYGLGKRNHPAQQVTNGYVSSAGQSSDGQGPPDESTHGQAHRKRKPSQFETLLLRFVSLHPTACQDVWDTWLPMERALGARLAADPVDRAAEPRLGFNIHASGLLLGVLNAQAGWTGENLGGRLLMSVLSHTHTKRVVSFADVDGVMASEVGGGGQVGSGSGKKNVAGYTTTGGQLSAMCLNVYEGIKYALLRGRSASRGLSKGLMQLFSTLLLALQNCAKCKMIVQEASLLVHGLLLELLLGSQQAWNVQNTRKIVHLLTQATKIVQQDLQGDNGELAQQFQGVLLSSQVRQSVTKLVQCSKLLARCTSQMFQTWQSDHQAILVECSSILTSQYEQVTSRALGNDYNITSKQHVQQHPETAVDLNSSVDQPINLQTMLLVTSVQLLASQHASCHVLSSSVVELINEYLLAFGCSLQCNQPHVCVHIYLTALMAIVSTQLNLEKSMRSDCAQPVPHTPQNALKTWQNDVNCPHLTVNGDSDQYQHVCVASLATMRTLLLLASSSRQWLSTSNPQPVVALWCRCLPCIANVVHVSQYSTCQTAALAVLEVLKESVLVQLPRSGVEVAGDVVARACGVQINAGLKLLSSVVRYDGLWLVHNTSMSGTQVKQQDGQQGGGEDCENAQASSSMHVNLKPTKNNELNNSSCTSMNINGSSYKNSSTSRSSSNGTKGDGTSHNIGHTIDSSSASNNFGCDSTNSKKSITNVKTGNPSSSVPQQNEQKCHGNLDSVPQHVEPTTNTELQSALEQSAVKQAVKQAQQLEQLGTAWSIKAGELIESIHTQTLTLLEGPNLIKDGQQACYHVSHAGHVVNTTNYLSDYKAKIAQQLQEYVIRLVQHQSNPPSPPMPPVPPKQSPSISQNSKVQVLQVVLAYMLSIQHATSPTQLCVEHTDESDVVIRWSICPELRQVQLSPGKVVALALGCKEKSVQMSVVVLRICAAALAAWANNPEQLYQCGLSNDLVEQCCKELRLALANSQSVKLVGVALEAVGKLNSQSRFTHTCVMIGNGTDARGGGSRVLTEWWGVLKCVACKFASYEGEVKRLQQVTSVVLEACRGVTSRQFASKLLVQGAGSRLVDTMDTLYNEVCMPVMQSPHVWHHLKHACIWWMQWNPSRLQVDEFASFLVSSLLPSYSSLHVGSAAYKQLPSSSQMDIMPVIHIVEIVLRSLQVVFQKQLVVQLLDKSTDRSWSSDVDGMWQVHSPAARVRDPPWIQNVADTWDGGVVNILRVVVQWRLLAVQWVLNTALNSGEDEQWCAEDIVHVPWTPRKQFWGGRQVWPSEQQAHKSMQIERLHGIDDVLQECQDMLWDVKMIGWLDMHINSTSCEEIKLVDQYLTLMCTQLKSSQNAQTEKVPEKS